MSIETYRNNNMCQLCLTIFRLRSSIFSYIQLYSAIFRYSVPQIGFSRFSDHARHMPEFNGSKQLFQAAFSVARPAGLILLPFLVLTYGLGPSASTPQFHDPIPIWVWSGIGASFFCDLKKGLNHLKLWLSHGCSAFFAHSGWDQSWLILTQDGYKTCKRLQNARTCQNNIR